MVGSYKASPDVQVKRFESEEAPSGMMSRGPSFSPEREPVSNESWLMWIDLLQANTK